MSIRTLLGIGLGGRQDGRRACLESLESRLLLATFPVTTTDDGGVGSLRQAIIDANANPGADMVTIPAGTYTLTIAGADEDAGLTGDLDITQNLTIVGDGADVTIIDGNGLDRIFDIHGGVTVNISGVTIRGGEVATGLGGGGGIRSVGNLTLEDVIVTNNMAAHDGGGIHSTGNIMLLSSTVSGNEVTVVRHGGGVYAAGTASLINTTVNDNASHGRGGGVFGEDGSTLTITNSTIRENVAAGEGGGIRGPNITIQVSTISGNTGISGGGIRSTGQVTITDSTLSDNSVSLDGGGAMINGTLNLDRVTVNGNNALNRGGGLFVQGNAIVTNSTISGNSTGGLGGGIFMDQGTLRNVTITGNTAGGRGGGVSATTGAIQNSLIALNTSAIGPDYEGTLNSGGHNLIGDSSDATITGNTTGNIIGADPRIGPLANNGGPTFTHALRPGSPAIAAANTGAAPATDQRGVARPQGPAADIGAFEAALPFIAFAAPTVSVLESEGQVIVTVNRTGDADADFSVDFATEDDTAVAGRDYTATSGTLAFAPGVMSQQIVVPILATEEIEAPRRFRVVLSAPEDVHIAGESAAIVSIVDDRATGIYVTGAGEDARRTGGPHVRVFDAVTQDIKFELMPYHPNFGGGVRVAVGDINGDGFADIITAPGPGGGPHVRVFDGVTGEPIREIMAYHPQFRGGVYVAAADINGDGIADIITGAGGANGTPHVRVFSGATGEELMSIMAYSPHFRGGVRVAAGDVNGDGRADIITGAGPGGGPHVRVFSGMNAEPLLGFMAYDPFHRGGVYVAAGDVNADGRDDIITGAGADPTRHSGPHVRVFSGQNQTLLHSFFAYHPQFDGGVRVGAIDFNLDGRSDILTGTGPGNGSPHVKIFDGDDGEELHDFMAYGRQFRGGVYVAGGR
jgi:predicted outer membrane repeat protein